MDIVLGIWKWFASNFLTQPAYFISLIVAIGYILLKKKWYEIFAGFQQGSHWLSDPPGWFRRPGNRIPSSPCWT